MVNNGICIFVCLGNRAFDCFGILVIGYVVIWVLCIWLSGHLGNLVFGELCISVIRYQALRVFR